MPPQNPNKTIIPQPPPPLTPPSPVATHRPEAPPFDTTLPLDPPNDLPPRCLFPAIAAAVFIQQRAPLWFEKKYSAAAACAAAADQRWPECAHVPAAPESNTWGIAQRELTPAATTATTAAAAILPAILRASTTDATTASSRRYPFFEEDDDDDDYGYQ